jgi:hypothetical protein
MSRPLRLLRAGVLLGFAGLVVKLFAAGEMAKYMSPSLDPLTALAGLVLGVMGIAELRGGARSDDEPAEGTGDQVLTVLLLALPLVLGLAFSPRALGSSALGGEGISRLLLSFGGPPPSVRSAPPAPPRPIADFGDLLAYLNQHGERGVGQRVQVVGLPVGACRPTRWACSASRSSTVSPMPAQLPCWSWRRPGLPIPPTSGSGSRVS